MDLNKFYADYCKDPEKAKFELVQKAAGELFRAVRENYYDLSDLYIINYSEVCDWLDWPDFQDGGIFEDAIETAANMVLGVLGFKPFHHVPRE